MKAVYSRCAGLDVHKESVYVCIRSGRGKTLEISTAVFGTYTEDLIELRKLLRRQRVRQVAMESTGVYWIPIWNVLERSNCFDLVLVNPQHVKALPGRKTDQQDCERLAELAQYGLLKASLIPPAPIRELRDLTRLRVKLAQEGNRIRNRITRLLETANYKLSSAVSDITGKTGLLILHSLAQGETRPEVLVQLAQGSLRYHKDSLARALRGYSSEHFRWMLGHLLEELRLSQEKLEVLEGRLSERMAPYAEAIQRLCTIPGVQRTSAWTLIAELGVDMSRYPSAHHAASWAGLCPGQSESAGKRQSGRTRKGDRYLRRGLVQSAWTVTRKKDCFLTSLFFRVAQRRGMKKAAMAVAHRILILAFHILRDGTVYREVGGDYHDRQDPHRTAKRLTRRLERLGFAVQIQSLNLAQTGTEKLPHGDPATPPAGNCKKASPRRRSSKPIHESPASPELCPKCSGWGIPCIHAKNRKRMPPGDPSPSVAST